MDESGIKDRVEQLIDEEHQLRSTGTPVDPDRLRHIEEELDQCWDLLRQRRAKREFGESPDEAEVRPPGTVEDYRQ